MIDTGYIYDNKKKKCVEIEGDCKVTYPFTNGQLGVCKKTCEIRQKN